MKSLITHYYDQLFALKTGEPTAHVIAHYRRLIMTGPRTREQEAP